MARHDPEALRAFLGGETRQVWARERATGNRVYLDVGEADQARANAKSIWGCIIPTCDSPINTRGGSKRDSFYHPNGPSHGGGGVETMNHLSGKAMIAAWAEKKSPDATVTEETTLKDSTMDIYRRPDVLVSWFQPKKKSLALEIEYKEFGYEAWQSKQDDFLLMGIGCSWLIGHTRVKPTRAKAGLWDGTVKVPRQADIIATAGLHVLIVNPSTEQIGTLSGDRAFKTKVPPKAQSAWMALDDIDDCELTPQGIITPTMRRIDKAIDDHEQAKARRMKIREAALIEQRRLAQEAKLQALLEKQRIAEADRLGQERIAESDRIEKERTERWALWRIAWESDQLRSQMISRWGRLPDVIDNYDNKPGGIHANPAHWHAVLYEQLIHKTQTGSEFSERDCWWALRNASIPISNSRNQRVESIRGFLSSLVNAGLIAPAHAGWTVRGRIPTLEEGRAQERARIKGQELESHENSQHHSAESIDTSSPLEMTPNQPAKTSGTESAKAPLVRPVPVREIHMVDALQSPPLALRPATIVASSEARKETSTSQALPPRPSHKPTKGISPIKKKQGWLNKLFHKVMGG